MIKKLFSILTLVMILCAPVPAQQASPSSPITPTGSTGLAASVCLTATAASTVQATLSIPNPGPGNSIYLDYLQMAIEATGTISAVAPVPFTSTNFAGTPSWSAPQSALTIGQIAFAGGYAQIFNPPLKANTATSPTIVGPAGITNGAQRITGCWHVAP